MVRAKGMGYRVAEVPITFVDRGETLVPFGTNVQAADKLKYTGSLSLVEMKSSSTRR